MNCHWNTINSSGLFLISGHCGRELVLLFSFILKFGRAYFFIRLKCRAMAGLRILRLFGNPLEFLPEILPLHQLRHLSLVNIRIVSDENLRSVNVQIEVRRNLSYNLSATFHSLDD